MADGACDRAPARPARTLVGDDGAQQTCRDRVAFWPVTEEAPGGGPALRGYRAERGAAPDKVER